MESAKKIRFLCIITGLDMGGAETVLLRILERIDRSRFDPHVISLTTMGEIGPRIRALGISVEALNMRSAVGCVFSYQRLVKRLKELRPNLVFTMMYHANLLGGVAARQAGVPAVWGIHNCNLSRHVNKLSTLAVSAVCARLSSSIPEIIISCSEAAKQTHIAHGYVGGKILVIPNGFDLNCFRPDEVARVEMRRELGMAASAPLVGLIGRLDVQKNHLGFIKAISVLHKKLPQAHFLMAGQGVDAGNKVLIRAASQLGVEGACHFLGQRDDIPRVMAALDVLASSSVGEAFPNAIGEAMACGVPCAVTDVGDSAYMVGNTGRIVASGDMAGLADAIAALLLLSGDERRALGDLARKRVEQYFEISRVVKRYEEVLEAAYLKGGYGRTHGAF
jgi:glycosyltransferase involved in cell wall biosynthesis